MAELILQPDNNQSEFRQRKLMENCDLPPPTKLFSGFIDNPIYTPQPNSSVENKVSKALQLSQTRAREAERRMEETKKERDFAVSALVFESMRLMAYKRWVMMLEIQVEMLKLKTEDEDEDEDEGDDDCDDGGGFEKWKVGLVICLGLAGLGFACRFSFL